MNDSHDFDDRVRGALGDLGDARQPGRDWATVPEPPAATERGRPRLLLAAASLVLLVGVGLWWAARDRGATMTSAEPAPEVTSPVAAATSTTASVTTAVVAPPTTTPTPPSSPEGGPVTVLSCIGEVDAAATAPTAPAAATTTSVPCIPLGVDTALRLQAKVGATAQGQPGCDANACHYVAIEATGLAPNSEYRYECVSGAEGVFGGGEPLRSDADGAIATDLSCFYGYPGGQVWVTLTIRSEPVTWPAD